jgi:putative holliday junction resolvase
VSSRAPGPHGGVLAIDHGDKRTGFAFADALGITTTPLETFQGRGEGPELLEHIAGLRAQRDIGTFVVGLPLNADGSESPRCAVIHAFTARLSARFPDAHVAVQDEHLTSKAAEDRLTEIGRGGRAGRAQRDAWSALILLEDWLHRPQ